MQYKVELVREDELLAKKQARQFKIEELQRSQLFNAVR